MSVHTHAKTDSEDQETFFHSFPCGYYVQSPSTFSHANSCADLIKTYNLESTFQSPARPDSTTVLLNKNADEVSRNTHSRYSSRGSNYSFVSEKKIDGTDVSGNRLIHIVNGSGCMEEEEEEEDGGYYYGRKGGVWQKYFSLRKKNQSCAWVSLQISWRLVVSLVIALLVFYVASKPPPPRISIKMAGIPLFGLGEGVDASGVATKILTFNCSMNLLIENKSKLFGLHIHPPVLELSFGRLSFATSRGSRLYAESHSKRRFKLSVGTRNKPMYGAGRNMQDMLESGNGLPIVIRVTLNSNFRVVWNLVKPKYHHRGECLLVLDRGYDKKHRTQAYNSTCTIS